MKILITGAKGFIGKNLVAELKNRGYAAIFEYGAGDSRAALEEYTRACDFVFHLAGINRPKNDDEYMEGNFKFTAVLLDCLKRQGNKAPVVLSSSIQAELDNPYGKSKRAAERLLLAYEQESDAKVMIYRLPNVFGKWCRPNYNSVVATFCNNISRGLPIRVNDSEVVMSLVYIDDVVREFINALEGKANKEDSFWRVDPVYKVQLGKIAELIESFKDSREKISIPDMSDDFTRKLYSTYLSHLPQNGFSYPLKMNVDNRGSFTEFIRTPDRGQISINISKPGITKGNHWHHTKSEKFLVVSGKGIIKFRKNDSDEIIEYHVSGDKLEVVDIPAGYSHNITNSGDAEMVTVMWVNEAFDQARPDTYSLEVV